MPSEKEIRAETLEAQRIVEITKERLFLCNKSKRALEKKEEKLKTKLNKLKQKRLDLQREWENNL